MSVARKTLLLSAAALSLSLATAALADGASDAKAIVDKYASAVTKWDGPTSGPKATAGKNIVVLAADLKNGGILGVTNGVQEAAKVIGWNVKVIDGAGSVSGRAAAFSQALTLKPDGIVIAGFDAKEQQAALTAAQSGVKIVAWHAAPVNGPVAGTSIAANVGTDPMEVSKAAAAWAFNDAGGNPGVVIFTDSTYAIAIAKADKIRDTIKQFGGTVLEYVDTPIAETSTRMPQLTTTLLQRYGKKWTHALAINDIYFDFMGPALDTAGIPGDGAPKAVAAGDGSESAYARIRTGQHQSVTVAEPLTLQGWQLVDELNRALAGQSWSGYISPLHVVTKANVELDGGKNNAFDPDNHYRDAYKKIWTGM